MKSEFGKGMDYGLLGKVKTLQEELIKIMAWIPTYWEKRSTES